MQLALGYGLFDTTIRFDGDRDVDAEMSTVSFSTGWLINDRWTARATAGAILDGELKPAGGAIHDVEQGGLASVGMEYRALVGDGAAPFVDVSLFIGMSWAKTTATDSSIRQDYFATDARLGVRTSWNMGNNFFPFLALRVFGGPVQWELDGEDVTGSDVHHYQIALGAAARLGSIGVFAEWAGLGEKGFSAGLSTAW